MAFFFQNSLDIFVELIFFLFDDSFDVRNLSLFDIDLVHFFEVGHLAVFSWSDEGDRSSGLACSSGSSDSVGISFRILWNRIIDDMGHVIDVDSSGCDIGRYQDIHFPVFETLEKMLSLFLC